MTDIRIALAQITCPVGKLDENVEKHRACARLAAKQGARIICFPETSLTGYPTGNSIPHELAQPLDGPLGRAMAEASAETGVLILAGLVERDRSGVVYNTQLVAAPAGLAGGYRKAHVANSEIHRFYHGDGLPVFTYEGVRFGIQICYDNHFPEGSRVLALRGAEILFCPYGSPGPCTTEGFASKQSRWLRYLTARAFDNSIYVVVVNQVGNGGIEQASDAVRGSSTPRDTHCDLGVFPGGSLVLNPWGEVVATSKPLVEDVLVVELSLAEFQRKRADALQFFTHFRRPELYEDIARPSRASADRVELQAAPADVIFSNGL